MGPERNYTQEQMLEAIEAVKKGTPAAAAAKEFNVPRATLVYKASGKSPTVCRFGPPPVLTDAEEEIIKQWLLHAARLQYPITKELLCDSVQHIIKTMERLNPFNDGRPGRKWYEAFFRRHPELRERTVQPLTSARSGVTEGQLRNWFAEIKNYLEEKELFDITSEPRRVFNADESAFFLQPSGGKVITRKGEKNVYSANNNDGKENLTVLITANAAGDIAPPTIVFSYERIPSHIANSVPPSWGIGKSESGWMCGPVFFEYVTNIFLPWLLENGIQRPILLFIDGHVSHLTLHLSEFCSENGIELISLYPNSTHLLQPMDVAVFHPLKAAWRKEVRKWRAEHFGNKLKKENFAPVLSKCIDQISESTCKNGFKACGLCPFNVEQVDFNKIASVTKPAHGAAISDERVKVLEKGKGFLESNISKDKLANFMRNYEQNLWTGSVEDTSLFYLWKNTKMQLEMGSNEEDSNYEHEAEVVSDSAVSEEARNGLFAHSQIQSTACDVTDNSIENAVLQLGVANTHEEIQPSSRPISSPVPSTSGHPSMSLQETQDNSATINSSTSKSNLPENIPSPFKTALFWPDPHLSKSKKRKTKEKIPSAITSEAWQKYHKKKEQEKLQKQKEKEERANIRLEKRTQKELQKNQKNKKRLRSPSSSDDSEEWVESGASMEDVDILEESDEIDTCELLDKEGANLNVGDFVLAKFTSGKRKSIIYRYVCVVQKIFDEDDEVEVMCLKCLSDDKMRFKSMESDVSVIKKEDIIGKLPSPKYLGVGDRIKYQFPQAIDIYEQL